MADVFVLQVNLIYPMECALTVLLRSTGIIKIKLVKDVQILLFMIPRNKNVFVHLTNPTYSKEGAYHVIYPIIGIQILASAYHVQPVSNIMSRLEDVYVHLQDHIL